MFLMFEEDFRFERETPEADLEMISIGQLREASDDGGSGMRNAEDPLRPDPKYIQQCISCSLFL